MLMLLIPSLTTLKGTVITTCTTYFNVKLLRILPTECLYMFYVILRVNSDVSLNISNQLIFVIETSCVFVEGGAECLNIRSII
jgi:hypothetical protein